ncbi:hypothetical protein [Vampirovibrio sp.]|uniref:hypothetical protein n=1 Tax=Vampirovibrio sp. TaxID=2717857 RepID=UPI0035945948
MTLVPSHHKVRCKTDQHGWPSGCEVIEEPPLLPTLVETIGKILDPDFELPPDTRKRLEEGPVMYAGASQLNANPQPTVIHGRVYEQGSPSPPVIRGRVEKGGGRDGGGGGVGDVLGGIADIILTGIQVAAPIFLAYLQAKNSGGGGTTVVYENNDLSSYQSQPRQIIEAPQVQPSRVQYMPSQSNPNLSRDALNRIKRPEFQAGTPLGQLMDQGHRVVQGIVNAGEQFKRQFDNSISRPEKPYDTYEPPAPGISMAEILNPTNQAGRPFIQEDQAWIQHNLSKAQKPLTWQDRLMAEQAQRQAIQQQTLDAQRQLAQAQQELAQAQLNKLRREIFERGEKATGRKSHLSPKRVSFNDEGDLTDKLWDHFYQGQGQPVEVDLRKVNLTEDLNMPRLLRGFNSSAVTLMRFPNPSKKALQDHFKAKNPTIGANPKVTHVILGEPFIDVALDITREDDPEQWAAFGRLAVDVNDVHILVDHTKKIVTVEADLGPSSATRKIQPDLIEDFDFNPDPGRDIVGELGTRAVHHFAPPGSTSYQIRRVPGTVSHFKLEYSFKEFFGY